MKTNYEFRGELFRRSFPEKQYPIIDFSCLTKGMGKGRSKFNDGPIVHIDEMNFSIFDFLYQLDDVAPSKEKIERWVAEKTSFKDKPGIYYINTGLRRAVLTTKSVTASVAKVLFELIHATNESDLFLKRTARSQIGGNWQTLLIEDLLDDGVRPDGFVSSRELKLWRDKTFKAKKVIDADQFKKLLDEKIEDD